MMEAHDEAVEWEMTNGDPTPAAKQEIPPGPLPQTDNVGKREGLEDSTTGYAPARDLPATPQKECSQGHERLRWNAGRGQFECEACDAVVDAPELLEAVGEPDPGVEYEIGSLGN